ncbi:MAG: GldG family protein [Acidobacteriota bacterium]
MARKVIDSLAWVGIAAAFGGYFYYSVNNTWNWAVQAAIYGGAALILISIIASLGRIRTGLRTRTFRYGSTAALTLMLVIGILALLNYLNYRHHERVDLTENQLYALSDQTQKVLQGLDTEIRVIGFFTGEAESSRFEDLVSEYAYISSNFQHEVVDPQKEPGRAAQYEIERVGQVVVTSGTKQEMLDQVSEEQLTNAIIKVTREDEKTVYFLQGHGERDINDTGAEGYSAARDAIQSQNYRVETYNLAQENQLPEDATLLVSAGPQIDFFPNEVELLKEYFASGGKLLLMVDPQNDFRMEDFLSSYGLSLGHNVVIDASGVGRLFGLGVAAPLVAEYSTHPISEGMEGIMTFFPMAQSVHTSESSLGFETQTVLSTSARSWGELDLKGNEATYDEGDDVAGPLNLAAVATRKVEESDPRPSNQGVPGGQEEGTEPGVPGGPQDEQAQEARFILFGDSDFANNSYFKSAANGDLFLNSVSWLAQDVDLIAIRPKDPTDRRINLTVSESRLIFWGTVIFLPLATLIFGISIWYRRR